MDALFTCLASPYFCAVSHTHTHTHDQHEHQHTRLIARSGTVIDVTIVFICSVDDEAIAFLLLPIRFINAL